MKICKAVCMALNLFFPSRCILCGKIISYGSQLCEKCSSEAVHICSKKRIYVPAVGKTILCYSPFKYKNIIRQSIIKYKFYDKKELADFFAYNIAQQIIKSKSELHVDIISCVPISKQRGKIRGYNQSELLAKALAKRLNIPFGEYLVKIKDNKEQHKLNEKDRLKNVRNVYITKNADQFQNKSILLVDDIVTTGATLGECASVLFQNGVKDVTCTAIAQVMP